MPPRPILKARISSFAQRSPASPSSSSTSPNTALPFPSCKPGILTPHVHFPPTPVIASTQSTHSSSTYDRTAIAVSPNSCELPERGGRCYSPSYAHHRVMVNSYFDPLAVKACGTAPDSNSAPPPLVADTSSSSSSESDDSDAYGSPMFSPPNIPFSPSGFASSHTSVCSIPSTFSEEQFIHALSFLPHPPSLVKDNSHPRPKLQKKNKYLGRRRGREMPITSSNRWERNVDDSALDGCLGGF